MSRSCHNATFSSAGITAAADQPGEPGQVLGQDRVLLVRHRRAALLAGGERLGDLADLGPLQVTNLGRQPLDPARDHGKRGEEHGVPVARDHLGRDRLRSRARGAPRRAPRRGDRRWQTCRPRPRARRSRSRRAPAPGAAGCARTRRRTRRASGRRSSARHARRASARCTWCACARARAARAPRARGRDRRAAGRRRRSAAGRARCRADPRRSCRGADNAPRAPITCSTCVRNAITSWRVSALDRLDPLRIDQRRALAFGGGTHLRRDVARHLADRRHRLQRAELDFEP